MKKIIYALLFSLLMASVACADVEINAENFPDDVFRAYVSENFDTDSNGILTDAEIAGVTEISIMSSSISSLQGVKYFTALTYLECYATKLTELDMSGCTALETLLCSDNDLTSLDVSGCTGLTVLGCSHNPLTALNISGCTALEELGCGNTRLAELDVKHCEALTLLYCGMANLTSLDVSHNTALTELNCYHNLLTSLDVSHNTALTKLTCNANRIERLDVSKCPDLVNLYCQINNITSLNVEGCAKIVELICDSNKLTELDVSTLDSLVSFSCGSNQLTSLKFGKSEFILEGEYGKYALEIVCSNNLLTELDVSGLKNLGKLYCSHNLISVLKLPDTSLTGNIYLECSNNQITQMGHSAGYEAYYVSADNGPLTKQTVSSLSVQNDATGQSYPFHLDMSLYVSPDNFAYIKADSVKGFDENNSEIASVYENGTARFASSPAKVTYRYDTGFKFATEEGTNITLDVTISEMASVITTLNNHVYRIFNREMSWENARIYCESLGGHLAILTSTDEIALINEMLERERKAGNYHYKSYWIGAGRLPEDTDHYSPYNYGDHTYDYLFWRGYQNQYDDSAKWHWIDGTEFSGKISLEDNNSYYEEKLHGPFNYFGDLRLTVSLTGEFVPLNKDVLRGFICEWEPSSTDFIPFIASRDNEAFRKDKDFSGYLEDPRDMSNLMSDPPKVSIPVTLPAKFDPRTSGRSLPAVRNQGSYGTCWSFASIGALETSYMTKFGKTVDLSELHQAWFVYKDPRKAYAQNIDSSTHVLSQGGIASYSIHFLSGIGPTSENSLAYDNATISNIERLTAGKYPEDYPHPVKLKDAYELGSIKSENRESMMKIVKNLVYEYGSIEVGYDTNSRTPGFNANNTSYYLPASTTRTGGHAVQIVGWDDNYSRTNFKNNPGINGAWLIKNSWGSNWGDGGYFWLSYAQNLHNVSAYISAEFKNSNMYGHDALAANHASIYRWGASVFRAVTTESLSAVAFYTRANNVPYKIYVIVHGKDQPTTADFTIPATPSAEGTQDYAGYHTVNLASSVSLKAGEYFTVILNLGGSAPWMVMENDNDNGRDITSVVTTAGKTFFSRSTSNPAAKDWVDGKSITGGSFNASIRAFTGTVSGGGGTIAPSITTSSLPDGTVGQSYTAALSASGSVPIQWTASGLPSGLTCNSGTITGTPSSEGSYSVTVTAQNSSGKDSKTLSLKVSNSSNPDNPDNPDDPDDPDNPYTPGLNSVSSSSGGGCSSFTALFGAMAAAFMFARRSRKI